MRRAAERPLEPRRGSADRVEVREDSRRAGPAASACSSSAAAASASLDPGGSSVERSSASRSLSSATSPPPALSSASSQSPTIETASRTSGAVAERAPCAVEGEPGHAIARRVRAQVDAPATRPARRPRCPASSSPCSTNAPAASATAPSSSSRANAARILTWAVLGTARNRRARALFAPLGPTRTTAMRRPAQLRPGSSLAPLPRLAYRARGPQDVVLDVATRNGRRRDRARAPLRLHGRRRRPEPRDARRRPARASRAPGSATRIDLVEGRAEELPFADAQLRRADLHLPAALRRRPGRDPARARARRPAGRTHRLARVPRPAARARARALGRLRRHRPPAARPRRLARLGARSAASSARASATSTRAIRSSALLELWRAAGIEDVRARPLSLGGGVVDLGRAWPLICPRPAFYALARAAGATT